MYPYTEKYIEGRVVNINVIQHKPEHSKSYALDINTTLSTCEVQGNISTGWTDSVLYADAQRIFISLAIVAGLHEI